MTESERDETKAKLIELGFWGPDEGGDPTTDIRDAGILNDRLDEALGKNVYLIFRPISDGPSAREVVILDQAQEYRLVTAVDYVEAICLAALELPEFLKQHPECAAEAPGV